MITAPMLERTTDRVGHVATLRAPMTTLDAPRPQAGSGASKRPTSPAGEAGTRRRAGRIAWLTVLFIALLGVMIRMSPTSMNTTFPNLGDPVLYAWALSWNAHAVVTSPLHLFDANIFWPHPLSLAYSDNMFVVMPPFALVPRSVAAGLSASTR